MTHNERKVLDGLTSGTPLLVTECLLGLLCLGFALLMLYGVEEGLPRGLLGLAFALTIIGSASLTRCVEGFKLRQRIRHLMTEKDIRSAEPAH